VFWVIRFDQATRSLGYEMPGINSDTSSRGEIDRPRDRTGAGVNVGTGIGVALEVRSGALMGALGGTTALRSQDFAMVVLGRTLVDAARVL